jgi:hypothetical protein
MAGPGGYLVEYENGLHVYLCGAHYEPEARQIPHLIAAARRLVECDRREEAIWCEECDGLLLASQDNQDNEEED